MSYYERNAGASGVRATAERSRELIALSSVVQVSQAFESAIDRIGAPPDRLPRPERE